MLPVYLSILAGIALLTVPGRRDFSTSIASGTKGVFVLDSLGG